MDDGPYEVELRGGGWKGVIGHGRLTRITHGIFPPGSIDWQKFELSEFFFCQAAVILIAQGRLLQDFFPPDVYFQSAGRVLSRGPYFLLKGTPSKVHDPPPRLTDMVLARVLWVPLDMKMEDLRGKLLEQVL